MAGMSELSQRHGHLLEIRGVMTAMRSLSLVETHKLARSIAHLAAVRGHVEQVLAGFHAHHPDFLPAHGTPSRTLIVLVGTERGFCGNFNERLLDTLRKDRPPNGPASRLVVVGQRLARRIPDEVGEIYARLEGATVSEDLPRIMDRLVSTLDTAVSADTNAHTQIDCLAHDAHGVAQRVTLLPPPRHHARDMHGHAPRLTLAPAQFYRQVLDHYLFNTLEGLLLDSLAAESRQRLAHMENAINRLDENLERLKLRRNALRQEHIVEEIEVILAAEQATGS